MCNVIRILDEVYVFFVNYNFRPFQKPISSFCGQRRISFFPLFKRGDSSAYSLNMTRQDKIAKILEYSHYNFCNNLKHMRLKSNQATNF